MHSDTYSQKVGKWIESQTGCSLLDLAKNFGYYPVATTIIGLDEADEKKSKPIIAKNPAVKSLYIECNKSASATMKKGVNRSWTQYFKDIITGWILEDLVLQMFKEKGIDISHNGGDSNRKISTGAEVSQDADFVITVGSVKRKVEITNEFNTFIKNEGYIEKRAPALYRAWKNKVIWLYQDLTRGKYVLVDFATENVLLHLRHHKTWAKDIHRYVLSENDKKERDDRLLAAEMITVAGCSIEGREQPALKEIIDMDSPPIMFNVGGGFLNKPIEVTDQQESTSFIPEVRVSLAQPQELSEDADEETAEQGESQDDPSQSVAGDDSNTQTQEVSSSDTSEEMDDMEVVDFNEDDFV